MRWQGQGLGVADGALPGLERDGVLRTVRTPEFEGITFHEVLCKSALNRVPEGSPMGFQWTVNPMRGCTHACRYCFARPTHEYLDLDAGADFDSQIVVKVNVAAVLRKELRRRSWVRESVALGTNTDPYQRAEGRYRLMPGIIRALTETRTPFSVLTKGTLLRRDLPQLAVAGREVPVSLAVSLAFHDEATAKALDPGAPSPAARLALIRSIRDAGFGCQVLLAPVIPYVTDRRDYLLAMFVALADAGATGISVIPLHLRGSTRGWFMQWLAEEHPALVGRYQRLYGRSGYVTTEYRTWLAARADAARREVTLDASPAPVRPVSAPASAGAVAIAPAPAPTLF